MSAQKQNPLNDYVSGARKLQTDEGFRNDTLEMIRHSCNDTVVGMERIPQRRWQPAYRFMAVAAVICCVIGIVGYGVYRKWDTLKPWQPSNSQSEDWSSVDTHSSLPTHGKDTFQVYDAMRAQLSLVEAKLAEYELKMQEDALTADEQKEQMELEAQKASILAELCRSGEFMIAHTRFHLLQNRITLLVVNGTDETVTLPPYYVTAPADGEGSMVGGCIETDNRWNLRELPAHSSVTVSCDLRMAAVRDFLIGGTGGEQWRTEESWVLVNGVHTVSLTETLSSDAAAVHTAEFTVANDVPIVAVNMENMENAGASDIVRDDTIEHIDAASVRAMVQMLLDSGESKESACQAVWETICGTNGRADWEASGIHLCYYCIEDGGTVISDLNHIIYVYYDPETGVYHTGSLLDIGTFGEPDNE